MIYSDIGDRILQKCRDYYKISTDAYETTLKEGKEVRDMYHNRQYTQAQLLKLKEQGQPAETFNVIRLFTNAVMGYLETVVTSIQAVPRYPGDSVLAQVTNDAIQYILEKNSWDAIEKFVKIDGLLNGLMAVYLDVVDTGVRDEFGRPIYEITIDHIPSYEMRIDPRSVKEDYSDARFIHHAKWIPEDVLRDKFPKKKVDELIEYYNSLGDSDSFMDWDEFNNSDDIGEFKRYNNYLVVKSIVKDKDKYYSVVWSNYTILEKKEISYKEVKFPYRVIKLSKSDKTEYYGIFRDIVESQKAINQALLKIQLLVESNKVFVEEGAVENIEEFRQLYSRVNSVIPVISLSGVKVENFNADVIQQYHIIDTALARIKMILGVNDSFLGMAYASDSGRKVQLQKMSSAAQMTSLVDRIGFMFRYVGEDIFKLMRQYYNAHQILRISDPLNAYHYTEINKPILMPTGRIDPNTNEPELHPVLVPDIDPDTGKIRKDDKGNVIIIPLTDPDTKLQYADVDVKVIAVRADNSEEQNQMMLQMFMTSPMGSVLLQTNPAAFLKASAMMISEYGTKHSIEIARLLLETAQLVEQGVIDPNLVRYGLDIKNMLSNEMGNANAINNGGANTHIQNMQGGLGATPAQALMGGTPNRQPLPNREGGASLGNQNASKGVSNV